MRRKLATRRLVFVTIAVLAIGAPVARADGVPTLMAADATGGGGCSSPVTITFNGSVDPNGQDTTWYFEYGADTTYGTQTAPQDAGAGSATVAVAQTVPGTFGTTHFRLVATNASGPAHGIDQTVTVFVPPCPPPPLPSFVVSAGTPVAGGPQCATPAPTFSVVLSAKVTPAPSQSTTTGSASFVYGPSASHGQSTAGVPVPWSSPSGAPTTISVTVSGLPFGTTHYALVITSADGGTLGPSSDQTISIPHPPCVAPIHRTHTVSVRWSLLRLSPTRRAAVIRYRLPCAATKPHTRSVKRAGGVLTLAVLAVVPTPGAQCLRQPPLTTRTVHLPHAVTTALRHATVTA